MRRVDRDGGDDVCVRAALSIYVAENPRDEGGIDRPPFSPDITGPVHTTLCGEPFLFDGQRIRRPREQDVQVGQKKDSQQQIHQQTTHDHDGERAL